jgi:hypothetical protein
MAVKTLSGAEAQQALADFLVEQIMNASDEDVLEEARAYGDEKKLTKEVDMIFERAMGQAGQTIPQVSAEIIVLPKGRKQRHARDWGTRSSADHFDLLVKGAALIGRRDSVALGLSVLPMILLLWFSIYVFGTSTEQFSGTFRQALCHDLCYLQAARLD